MEAGEQFLSEVRAALGDVGSEDRFRLDKVDIYLGSNPLSDRPVMLFRVWAREWALPAAKLKKLLEAKLAIRLEPITFAPRSSASEKAAAFIGATAAALLSRELRIGTTWGIRGHQDGSADSWTELSLGAPAGPALKIALTAVVAEIAKKPGYVDRVGPQLAILRALCMQCRPNKMSGYLIDAARANGIPYHSLGRSKTIWQFGWGSRGRAFLGAACNDDGYVGFSIARNKLIAKQLFRELGLPTPRWTPLAPDDDPARAVARVGWPCVVKPIDSSLGEGVTTGIGSIEQLNAAVSLARGTPPRKLLIESNEPGIDHRLMVIEGHLFAAVRRDPPTVTGDGRSTLRQLVDRLNQTRLGLPEEGGFLFPVPIDRELLFRLQGLGLSLESILSAGTVLALRTTANHSTGGTASNVTAQVHPRVRRWAEELACTVGLRVAGIDYISKDISRDPLEVGGGFIEINATPGLQILAGAGFDRIAIGAALLGHEPGPIPVDLVLAERDAIDEALLSLERETGHAIAGPHSGEIGTTAIDAKRLTPFEIVGALLRHKSVERCTIVWTCEEMTLFGLPISRIRRTTLGGVLPDAEWLALLDRTSEEVVRIKGTADNDLMAADTL